jgi:hypothetical protein
MSKIAISLNGEGYEEFKKIELPYRKFENPVKEENKKPPTIK